MAILGQELKSIQRTKNLDTLVEDLSDTVKLFYNGLCDSRSKATDEQLYILDKLITATRLAVFARDGKDTEINRHLSKWFTLHVTERLTDYYGLYSFDGKPYLSKLSKYKKGFEEAISDVFSGKIKIDTIVYVSSGGLEPALMAVSALGTGNPIPIRYSPIKKRDKHVKFPKGTLGYIREQVKGKSILVVDDLVETGTTSRKVLNFVNALEPKALYFGAVISSYVDLKLRTKYPLSKYTISGHAVFSPVIFCYKK